MANESFGTSSVIVEPAATKVFVPKVTGATRFVFEPMKELSPIMVLLLLKPS